MSRSLVLLGVALCLLGLSGVAQVSPQVSLEDALSLLQAMPVEQGLRQATVFALREAVATGRASPREVYRYLEHAQELPPAEAAVAVGILKTGLENGLLVDRLLNKALQAWERRQPPPPPWEEIRAELELRLSLLLSVQATVTALRFEVEICPITLRQAVLEIGWALGDHIVEGKSPDDLAGMTSRVRDRLVRLRGAAPCARTVDALLEAVSPELIGEVVSRALAQRRR